FDGGRLTNSYIHDNAVLGVKVDGFAGYTGYSQYQTTQGAPVLIQNCSITHNNPNNVGNTGFEAGGIKMWEANNVSIINCTISNNVGMGIWYDTCRAGGVVMNSLITGNSMWGIDNEISDGSTFAFNTVTGNGLSHASDQWPQGGGICIDTGTGCTVRNNIVSG